MIEFIIKNILVVFAVLVCLVPKESVAETVCQRQQKVLEFNYYNRKNTSNTIYDITWCFSTLALAKNHSSIIKTQDFDVVNSKILALADYFTDEEDYWVFPQLISMLADPEYKSYLSSNSIDRIKNILYDFVKSRSKIADTGTNLSNIWYTSSSDNHNMMRRSAYLLVSLIFKNDPVWRKFVYDDGHTPEQHYIAYTSFFKEFFRQRALHGVQIEFGSTTYAGYYLQPIINIYKYCENNLLQLIVKKYLDLYFTDAAVESINGVRGGAKTRIYKNHKAYNPYSDSLMGFSWVFAGVPDTSHNNSGGFGYSLCGALDTNYRLPQSVLDLYLNYDKRGTFEYIVSRPARGTNYPAATGWDEQLWFPADLRYYSYVTPKFVLGSYTIDETKTYNELLNQNPWMGLIAADTIESRIGVTIDEFSWKPAYGRIDIYGMGNKGTLIFRRHNFVDDRGEPRYPRLYISASFTNFSEKASGWIIGKNSDSSVYFGLYCTDTYNGKRYSIKNAPSDTGGALWIYFTNINSLAVFEVALASKFTGLNDFETKLANNIKQWNNSNEFEYHSLYGDTFLFYRNTTLPKLNGQTVDLNPKKTYDCPYMKAEYGSPIINIRNAQTLDFNY